ncbi:MAG: type II 3-dehydroquinate dehydratase, partial [Coriobacteriales bacterium]
SYALHDAVDAISIPVVEVHLSDISQREEFRRTSVIAPACVGQIKGLGRKGYVDAIEMLVANITNGGDEL